MKTTKQIGRYLSAVIWPERCIFCGTPIPPLTLCCEPCREEIHTVPPPICSFCGRSRDDCDCGRHRHRYDRLASPFYCNGAVRRGILRLKRWDDPLSISFFAEQMAAVVRREFSEEHIDVITWVPMTRRDYRDRGYNQGELLAKDLGKLLSLPSESLLQKCYQTQPQKTIATAVERAGNVLGVFDVVTGASVADKTVLLVDDVSTTGATIDECAKMLKLYGARRVLCVTASVRLRDESEEEPV